MEFEWDEAKAEANRIKHGISFKIATRVFLDSHLLERQDDRDWYGEVRWIAIGLILDREIAVVYTIRDKRCRLISAREADSNERRAYWTDR